MKAINLNRAELLLLFSMPPAAKYLYPLVECYASDDDRLVGVVAFDTLDGSYNTVLYDRDSINRYRAVDIEIDFPNADEGRNALEESMRNYVRNEEKMKNYAKPIDIFSVVAKPEEVHPFFKMLLDPDGFFVPAKEVIRELSYHFEDKDGNFVNQFQSVNGLDARLWELYLWCYLREEGFDFKTDYKDAPDFLVTKDGETVAIEAVRIKRKQDIDDLTSILSAEEIEEKQKNEIPLMFGSSLFSKLQHKCQKKSYWNLPHVKGKPLLFAIADFHGNMSMTYSFPAIISILYGLNQKVAKKNDGYITLENETGITFKKEKGEVNPLLLNDQYKHVSAIMFSPCGTLSKFNRMGAQAGYGSNEKKLYQVKMCYNTSEDAIAPDVIGGIIDESCRETWADGMQIFHNPLAEIPLDPNLFPHAGHHFYKDGILESLMPENHVISTITFNLKAENGIPLAFKMHSPEKFNELKQKECGASSTEIEKEIL